MFFEQDKRFKLMSKIKKSIQKLIPKELFLRTTYRLLKSELRKIRTITKVVNQLLVVWHIINFARTKKELRRINHKKRDFPYEDYSAYM
jgi:hypothetical protein